MAKLSVTAFVTLDGVMQAPGGPEEDTSGGFVHGGWLVPHVDEEFGAFMTEVFRRPRAFLLGRTTYQIFAAHWPRVTDPASEPISVPLNTLPKYVASRTLERADWKPSTVLRDVVPDVSRLKQELDGELQVHGSAGLIQTLVQHDLVDELNLLTFPIALGSGKRLFGSGTVPTALQLAAMRKTSRGVVIATYQRVGRPQYGSFALDG